MKIPFVIAMTFLACVFPIWGRWELLSEWRWYGAALLTIVLLGSQPYSSAKEVKAHQEKDRWTGPAIFVVSCGSIAGAVLEWRLRGPELGVLWIALGAVVCISGMLLRWIAIRTLGRFFTVTIQTQTEQKIIQYGVYSRVRHPSYSGAVLAIGGLAVFLGSWFSLAAYVVLIAIVYERRMRHEEAALLQAFGPEYAEYCKKTKRMIPALW
jgi:protein-S-isoprenylcysteine O-methyltransferase Ste14